MKITKGMLRETIVDMLWEDDCSADNLVDIANYVHRLLGGLENPYRFITEDEIYIV